MEMESSRRSIDRSREPGLKKPRLVEDAERDRISNGVMDRSRPRVVSSNAPATGVLPSRFRTTERERDDSSSVRGVQQQGQQQQQSQQSHLELVSQYKTALAELTFNSKPIITNLTIIAGENLHAAKWIAATVCANILEVPSEQKLPSLYLLDSIVKNIGRDYIKYFAAKLPEVFCKAYRQVDSSIHPGMRHLFGTWKGVFPPSCLQMIEKELGIAPASNGSSGATTSRSESQSQRPPHSIHVNPKYLEARQRLQQSSKVKGGNASTVSIIPPAEVAERPDRTANIVSESVWTDLPLKMNDYKHPQRETSSEPVIEKNNAGYEDYEYSSDLSRNSDMGYGRAAERVTERDKRDKPWYGTEKNAAEAVVGQRNAFDSQRELSKFRAPKPALAAAALQPTGSTQRSASSGRGMNKNWKNSEEEEYMWDDMNSRLADRGSSDSSRKDVWPPNDAEKMELDDNVSQPCVELDIGSRIHRDNTTDSFSMVQRRQTAFGNLTPSMWPLRETHTRDNLKHMGITSRIPGQSENLPTSISGSSTSISPSLARTGLKTPTGLSASGTPSFGSLVNTLSSSGILGQPRHQPLHPASPSGQASILQRPHSPSSSAFRQQHESHNLTEEDHLHSRSISQLGPKTSHYVPQLNRAPQTPTTHNSFPIIPQNPIQSGTLQGFPSQSSQHLQSSSSLMNFPPRRPHSPFSFQPLPELTPSQHSGQIQKPVPQSSGFGIPSVTGHSLSSHTTNPAADVPGQSNTRNLLAAIAESGLLSNNAASGGFPNLSFLESGALSSKLQNHPPLPSGPPPTQIGTSSAPMATLASVLDSASPAGTLSLTSHPHRTSTLPPLPPGPPPSSSVVSTSSQTSNAASSVPNPYSGLLSSLVAKGLISTPTKESPVLPAAAAQVPSRLQNQSPGLSTNNSVPISSHPAPSATTIPKSSSGNELPFLESAVKSAPAIGSPATRTETKDLIGIEFKPEIIRQSHPSVISGLFDDLPHQCNVCGFRLKLKEQLSHHLDWHASRKPEPSSGRVSRKWYTTSCDWVAGNVNSSSGSVLTSSVGGMTRAAEQSEPVVLADESQCVCLLCGEIFEDFYCHERDEWMYKGAVYMPIPAVNGEIGAMDDCSVQGPIVHANCISPSSVYDLGLLKNVKQEPMDG